MKKRHLLLLTILFEGYVVLATELLAIRLLIPFAGSGTEVVAIIISAVLMPLAVGYHIGGLRYQKAYNRYKQGLERLPSPRKFLIRNLVIALSILTIGLSHLMLTVFFGILNVLGIEHYILQTSLYSLLFLVTPTFLLAQTVPLISNYFSRDSLSEVTGKMLFFSTTGSFFGSVFSTIVLMTTIGVHHTVILTLSLLLILVLLLSYFRLSYESVLAGMIFCVAVVLNRDAVMRDQLHIVSNNQYNTIAVFPVKEGRGKMLSINNSGSSVYAPDRKDRFPYIQYIEKYFIDPLAKKETLADILVIGAGGFTLGWDDRRNHYTFVDIDPAMRKVAEKHLLPEPLPPTKTFIMSSARAFVERERKSYDLIVIDLYTHLDAIPMESTTQEFLRATRRLLKPDGVLVANIVTRHGFRDAFSRRYYNTFASVFPIFDRQVIDDFNPWTAHSRHTNNMLHIFYNRQDIDDDTVYTDDRNTYSLDR